MKISALAFIALFGLAFTSCKKEYTCSCQRVYTNNDGTTFTRNDDALTFKDNKARATTRCNDKEGTGSDLEGSFSRECDIN